MAKLIEPKILKGFRDTLPDFEIKRKKLFEILEKNFSMFGFVPIDTPNLEYTEVLLGKGGGETDKQIYRFNDHGGRDVSMRFDLTVPFARYVAANKNDLYFPFKRFHISKVWRGENTQKGRYREFYQCDFDIVGADSAAADLEIILLMKKSIQSLGIDSFKIHLSNRAVFNRFLKHLELEDKSVEILRTVDKLGKIGEENVLSLLSETAGEEKSGKILSYISPEKTFEETLSKITELAGGRGDDTERIAEIYNAIKENNLEDYYVLDPSITRGLDYYTGIVFETFLTDLPSIGSVCSGGRYNNLASLYTKENLPGVGASIGIDRLLAGLEEIDKTKSTVNQCDCIIFNFDGKLLPWYHRLAEKVREKGLSCEVYPDNKKLDKQFKYSEKKNIPAGIICGSDEYESGTITVKDLVNRENFNQLGTDEGIDKILSIVKKGL